MSSKLIAENACVGKYFEKLVIMSRDGGCPASQGRTLILKYVETVLYLNSESSMNVKTLFYSGCHLIIPSFDHLRKVEKKRTLFRANHL